MFGAIPQRHGPAFLTAKAAPHLAAFKIAIVVDVDTCLSVDGPAVITYRVP